MPGSARGPDKAFRLKNRPGREGSLAASASLAMRALIDAGFRTAEITMTVPGATDVIRDLSGESDFLVGAERS